VGENAPFITPTEKENELPKNKCGEEKLFVFRS
jgi:hypothetical protein